MNKTTVQRNRKRPVLRKPKTMSGPLGSLAVRVYDELKREIITGVFKPGEALTENMLAKRYATSRTPVREAAGRLDRENLIRIISNKGFFVKEVTVSQLNDLYEFRATIESACARLAATKEPDHELLQELKYFAGIRYYADDRRSYVRFVETDTSFHVHIARLTGNQLFVNAVKELRSQTERLLYAAIEFGDYGELLMSEHTEIYNAIENRQPQVASELVLKHIESSRLRILRAL